MSATGRSAPCVGRSWAVSQAWGSPRAARISPGLAPRPKRVTAMAAARSGSRAKAGNSLPGATYFAACTGRGTPIRRYPAKLTAEPERSMTAADPSSRLKRFYAEVAVAPSGGGEAGFAVTLDGRTPRSPEGRRLVLPTQALAEAGRRGVGGARSRDRAGHHAGHAPGLDRHRPGRTTRSYGPRRRRGWARSPARTCFATSPNGPARWWRARRPSGRR